MAEKPAKDVQPPHGFSRLLWRAPIIFYKLRLGWLFGKRALLLYHTGRISGLPRENMLEVVRYDQKHNTYYVASGFGEKADWFQNIMKTPKVRIQVGLRKYAALAKRLTLEETVLELHDYNRRHPNMIYGMARFIGYQVEASDEG
ncbi:MAG: nitroreductase family deazaflavin-dependent oxidoreductase, partial [Anaerolineaceae bacterium]|nr:nitroreductase family deazaflavin-dependent oxidoreductase [Anaerolineaceae bacterium]